MTAKTKYSRSTWKKKQLQSNMNIPRLGNSACSLCVDRSIPQYLNAHVSDYQTCADVHLQLALLRYDNAMCAVGQQKYQEICCTTKKESKNALKLKLSLGILAAVFLVGCILRRFVAKQKNSKQSRDEYVNKGNGLPMTHQSSSASSTGSSTCIKSHGSSELELPTTMYHNMDSVILTVNRTNSRSCSRSKSRSRSRGRPRTRPSSRSRERPQSRTRTCGDESLSRSDSTSRSRATSETNKFPWSMSRGKQTSAQNRSRNRSKSRDRRREKTKKNPSYREEYNHQFQPTGHVIEYNINPYHRHEEVEVSSDAGPILPTQLV
jgi:hypothetical protein